MLAQEVDLLIAYAAFPLLTWGYGLGKGQDFAGSTHDVYLQRYLPERNGTRQHTRQYSELFSHRLTDDQCASPIDVRYDVFWREGGERLRCPKCFRICIKRLLMALYERMRGTMSRSYQSQASATVVRSARLMSRKSPRTISSSTRRAQSTAWVLVRKVLTVLGKPFLHSIAWVFPEGSFRNVAMCGL
jgi:hypothetical protein